MGIFLFLVSFIFSSIFFIFYNLNKNITSLFSITTIQSLSGNLLIESVFFLFLGVFFLSIFSKIFEKKENHEKKDYSYFLFFLKSNFKSILLYIGFILFYLAIFFILKDFNLGFNDIILAINILIFGLFFISNKSELFIDFVKINTIIFSGIYIFYDINGFVSGINKFNYIDYLNTFILFLYFITGFYIDKNILKKNSDTWFFINFFIYILMFFVFYFNTFFNNLILILAVFSGILSAFIFQIILKLEFFKNGIVPLKVISIFFSYISIISSIFCLYNGFINYLLIIILIYFGIFNFLIHKKYQNYISFSFSLISTYFIIFYLFYNIFYLYSGNSLYFIVFSLFIAFIGNFLTYIFHFEWYYDIYFLHVISFLILIFSNFFFFFTNIFDLLNMGIILLIDSIFVFISYNKLKQIQ